MLQKGILKALPNLRPLLCVTSLVHLKSCCDHVGILSVLSPLMSRSPSQSLPLPAEWELPSLCLPKTLLPQVCISSLDKAMPFSDTLAGLLSS